MNIDPTVGTTVGTRQKGMAVADEHLSDADVFTVMMEDDPVLRSTIVVVATLDKVPDWERLTERAERATRLAPNFRRRLHPGAPPLAQPRWVRDLHFDLSWHMRRVAAPEPRTLDTVLDFARVAGMTAFDPIRPRWEFTLFEGLADGGAAFVLKLHHALTDGIGGIELAEHLVDLEREPGDPEEMPPEPEDPSGGMIESGLSAARFGAARLWGITRNVARVVPAFTWQVLRHPISVWGDAAENVRSTFRFVKPITKTASPIMTDRHLSWRYNILDVPLSGLKESASSVSGTLNDAFLAGIAGGLAKYHAHHDETVEEVRVTMPISLREKGDRAGGNRISLVRVTIPVGDHDPATRMKMIGETTDEWRAEPALPHSETIAGVLNLLPAAVLGGMLKHVDLVASNVPGFNFDIFLAGARLTGFWVFGPTIGTAGNITLMSYSGRCYIGVNTDGGAVPDDDKFIECMRAGFDEVIELAEKGTGERRPADTTSV